jgi:DNA-binding beta-propeller fold protein YncE
MNLVHIRWSVLSCVLVGVQVIGWTAGTTAQAPPGDRHYIYAALPGVGSEVEHGGVGVLVFDADNNHKFVKRIPTWNAPRGHRHENIKGIAASPKTGLLYLSTIHRLAAIDLVTEKIIWQKGFDADCCDRMAVSPDGKLLYVPAFEEPKWYVVDAITGSVVTTLEVKGSAHNTIYSPTGSHVYLASLGSPILSVADPKIHKVVRTVGPFSAAIRPFTINGTETRVYVNVNNLLGFEIGDLRTGKVLQSVTVEGFKMGKVAHHGCPSHGIALTHDESELWISDGANSHLHIFDLTGPVPRQKTSIKVRDQPGWITFSIDGSRAYASTGEVIDVVSKKILTTLQDEENHDVQSEKLVEIVFRDGKPILAGDQFALGMKR